MTQHEQQARVLVEAYLGGRRVPETMQTLIERAVVARLLAGLEPALDAILQGDLDAFAEAAAGRDGDGFATASPGSHEGDSGPATSTEVHWSTLE
jgi:hypothetical protein